MNRLAVFDCDGTLVDSGASICAAMAHGFAACGLMAPAPHATRSIIGLSILEAIRVLHPNGEAETHDLLAEAYKKSFFTLRRQGALPAPLYAGIVEAVAGLEERGWLLGVATGKSDRGLNAILDAHELHPRFVTLQTADRHPSKPHPSMLHQAMADAGAAPETTAMIGDTSYDMAMAKAAGVAAIGVAWGYHSAAELRSAGAEIVIGHASELVAVLEALP